MGDKTDRPALDAHINFCNEASLSAFMKGVGNGMSESRDGRVWVTSEGGVI